MFYSIRGFKKRLFWSFLITECLDRVFEWRPRDLSNLPKHLLGEPADLSLGIWFHTQTEEVLEGAPVEHDVCRDLVAVWEIESSRLLGSLPGHAVDVDKAVQGLVVAHEGILHEGDVSCLLL